MHVSTRVARSLGSVLALLFALTFSVSTSLPAHAAPAGGAPRSTTSTSSGSETLQVPAKECSILKAAYPAHANDPKLCQFVHHWTRTDTFQNAGSATTYAAANSCPTGTTSFHDYNTGEYWWWQMDMNTTFRWNGDCGYPDLTSQNCYVEWAINTTFSSESCYSYHYYASNWTSTASVYTAWRTTTYPGGIVWADWESQRRECYSNAGAANCNWTWWIGK